MNNTHILIVIVLLLVLGGVGFYLMQTPTTTDISPTPITPIDDTPLPVEPNGGIGDGAEPLPDTTGDSSNDTETIIGSSANGAPITAYHFGTGETEVLFVGGAHGGYSWNTALVAYELIDYLDANPRAVPNDVRVTIIPVLNPDGLVDAVGTFGRFEPTDALALDTDTRVAARFNGNTVDLNRNFACDWSATAQWQNQEVSGGSAPFSEPEAAALRDYVTANKPAAAVVWFSAEGRIYPSACGGNPSTASRELASTFGVAAGYPVNDDEEFSAYAVTGDMVNWMAGEGIPAISVLLTDHQNLEWTKNRAGIEAVLNSVSQS